MHQRANGEYLFDPVIYNYGSLLSQILHSRAVNDFIWRQTIVHLPPELISVIAELLCDKDLYGLTRVCHRLASVTCPIFLARQGLRQCPQSLSLREQAFRFLPMWHRSPAFSPIPLLFCWFSVYSESAAAQMKCLQKTLPMLSSSVAVGGTLFNSVYLCHVVPINMERVLGLLHTVVFRTKCRSVSLRATGFHDPLPKLSSSSAASVLRTVHELSLSYDRLSVSQWTSFLSGLATPSLESLEIVGGTSMGAVHKFLVRHPGVRQLSFTRCTMKPLSPSSRQLHMPDLDVLKGSLCQVLDVLESLSVLPHLSELLIEPGAYIKMPHDTFMEEIMRCLAMCDEVIRLVVKIPQSMLDNGTLIVDGPPKTALALTLANCHLIELLVEFEDVSDEVMQVISVSVIDMN